jgi:hypothetical protein
MDHGSLQITGAGKPGVDAVAVLVGENATALSGLRQVFQIAFRSRRTHDRGRM